MSGFEKGVGTINDQFDINASGTGTYSSAYGRYGGIGWKPNLSSGSANYNGTNFAASNNNGPFFFRVYIRRVTSPSADNTILQIQNTSNVFMVRVKMTSTGTLVLSDEDGTIGSASGVLEANRWYRLEVKVDASGAGSTDIVEACLDGVAFATASNRNLSTGIAKWIVGTNIAAEAQTTGEWHFDDMACNDATGSQQTGYPGTGTIINLAPNGDGDSHQFLKSGGGAGDANNYQDVDELNPDGNTTYLKSNTTGHIDFYTVTDAPFSSNAKVVAVGVNMRFAGDGASANGTIRCKLKKTSGGTIVNGATQSPTSTTYSTNAVSVPRVQQIIRTVDPDSAEWTKSTVDSMQIGVECVSSNTNGVRVTQISADVEYIPVDLTGSVTDNFNDNVLDPSTWENWGGAQVAEANGRLEMTSTLASGYYGVNYADKVISRILSLIGSSCSIKIADAGNQSITSFEMYFGLSQDDGTDGFDDGANQLYFVIKGGTLYATRIVASANTTVASAAYSATSHKYLRMREASGVVYWDTSTDGITWTNFGSWTWTWSPNRLVIKPFIGTWQVEGSTTVAAFDNLNVVPTRTTVTKSLRYAVDVEHPVTKSLRYAVAVEHAVTKSLRYAVSVEHPITKSEKYAVIKAVAVTKSDRYAVATEHPVTKSLAYKVKTQNAVTKSLKYCVLTDTATTKQIIYAVAVETPITKGLTYRVKTQTADTKSLKYEVQTETKVMLSLKYCVETTDSVTKSLAYYVAKATAITKAVIYEVRRKWEQLTDAFEAGSLDPQWTQTSFPGAGNISFQDGQVYIETEDAGAVYTSNGFYSTEFLDLRESYAMIEVVDLGPMTTGDENYIAWPIYAVSEDNFLNVYFDISNQGGVVYLDGSYYHDNGVDPADFGGNYMVWDPAIRFVRIRNSGTTVYWEYSTDGTNWTILFQVDATGFIESIGSLKVGPFADQYTTGGGSTRTVVYDNWNVAVTEATSQKSLTYAVKTSGTVQKNLTYAVKSPASVTKSLQYVVQTTGPVLVQKGLIYAVVTEASAQLSSRYAVAVKTPITKSTKYTIVADQSATKSLKYTVQTASPMTLSLKYEVAVEGVMMKSLAYRVLTTGAVAKSLRYAVSVEGAITKGAKYSVRSPESSTKGLVYKIVASVAIAKNLTYHVVGAASAGRSLKYAVLTTSSIQLSLTYVRKLGGKVQLSLRYELAQETKITKSLRYVMRHNPYTPKPGPGPYTPKVPSPFTKKNQPYTPLPPLV